MKVQAVLLQKPRKYNIKKDYARRHGRIRLPDRQSAAPFCFVVIGLLSGVCLFCFRQDTLSNALNTVFERYSAASGASFAARFAGATLACFCAGLSFMYLGSSLLAAWSVLPFLLLRGMAVGLVSAWLTQQFAMQGVAYYFACLFPAVALQMVGLCLLAQRAIRLSCYIKSCLNRDSLQRETIIGSYLLACLPGLACLLLSSLFDALLRQWLSPSFLSSVR